MKDQLKIIIADDHPLFRIGVKTLIDNLDHFKIVGEANNGNETISFLKEHIPDIAILDIDMPEKNGIAVAQYIQENDLLTKVIFLTSHSDLSLFKQAFDTDFFGFLFKESALEEMEDCFKTIMKGETYISPVTKRFIETNKDNLEKLSELEEKLNKLTSAEKKVLNLIIQNKTTKEIAEELFNSYKTIENHRLNICHKLEIKGTNNLLSFAIHNKEIIQTMLDN
jgi:DNA-binding NarL/FixJ family response regulator